MEDLSRFGPRQEDSDRLCPACHEPFKKGSYSTLIALGPGDDPEEQEKCRQGRAYNAVAIEVHYKCATGND